MNSIIKLEDLYFCSEDFEILKKINLSIPEEKCSIIMGASGCGKSTLLKVIAGIYPPDSGNIFFKGKNFYNLSDKELLSFRKNSGFIFQDSALWDNTSIYHNISLPLKYHFRDLSSKEIEKKINKTVKEIGFTDSLKLRPARLSFGEKKVISFLRAIITDPEMLFMDNPIESMDNQYKKTLFAILNKLKQKKCTMVLVSQNSQLVSYLADYLIIVKDGEVIEVGEFNNIKKSRDNYVKAILSKVLGEAASFDTELLDLLNE